MSKTFDMKQFLTALATKYDCKLVPKKKSMKIELPGGVSKYDDLSSKQLSSELKDLELDIKKRQAQNERLREAVTSFMNSQNPSNTNKAVYEGTKFNYNKLNIFDKELVMLTNLKKYVEDILDKALEEELINKFVAINPEFKDVVTGMYLSYTEVSKLFVVEVQGETKPVPFQKQLAQPPPSNVTTTKSLGVGG